jgi:hypothetical protein
MERVLNMCEKISYVVIAGNIPNGTPVEIGEIYCGRAYTSPELAVLVQPAYVKFDHPRIFEASGEMNHPLRSSGKFTLLRETHVPEFTLVQRQWFAIQCALKVCNDPVFVSWANAWINGTDRSVETAKTVLDEIRKFDSLLYTSPAWAVKSIIYASALHFDSYVSATDGIPGIDYADLARQAIWFEKEFWEIDF